MSKQHKHDYRPASHPRTQQPRVSVRGSRHRPRRIVLTILGLLVIVLVGSWVWYSNALRSTGAGQSAVTVTEAETVESITAELKTKQLIRSPLAFKIHVRLNGLAAKFQAGQYAVSGDQSAPVIAKELAEGAEAAKQFTIKEGLTQRQVAAQLGKLGIVDEDEFADLKAADFPQYEFLQGLPADASLEGFLFPETYSVPPPGTGTKDVATIMLNQFDGELTPAMREQIKSSGRTIFEVVTVASLVEEEVKSDKDRRMVAGIMYKRLEDGIRLDIDATTRYAVGKPTGALTQTDLNSDDPYNTRKLKGLPPGPIASPGLSALKATINPQTSDYLFYLSAKDGTTYYAKTNAEHEENKDKYLR